MMAVEIKQTLERDFEVFLTAQDIRNLTFERLHEIENENECKGEIAKEVQEMYLQLQLRFIADESVAHKRIVQLESLGDGPKVYIVPGIEGMAPMMEALARNIKGQVFCVQYDLEADSISNLSYYIYEVFPSKKFKIYL